MLFPPRRAAAQSRRAYRVSLGMMQVGMEGPTAAVAGCGPAACGLSILANDERFPSLSPSTPSSCCTPGTFGTTQGRSGLRCARQERFAAMVLEAHIGLPSRGPGQHHDSSAPLPRLQSLLPTSTPSPTRSFTTAWHVILLMPRPRCASPSLVPEAALRRFWDGVDPPHSATVRIGTCHRFRCGRLRTLRSVASQGTLDFSRSCRPRIEASLLRDRRAGGFSHPGPPETCVARALAAPAFCCNGPEAGPSPGGRCSILSRPAGPLWRCFFGVATFRDADSHEALLAVGPRHALPGC